jgi:uncharacterized protein (DUF736 family)
MPLIGHFTRDESGFIGHLATLLLDQDIIIVRPSRPMPRTRQISRSCLRRQQQ